MLAEKISCPVQRSQLFMKEFLAGPMCGRCFLCAFGTYEMLANLKAISSGEGTNQAIFSIKRIAENMTIGSLCKRGKDTGKFVLSCLQTEEFHNHIQGSCPSLMCSSFFEYKIVSEKCNNCGLCKEACKSHAIIGKKKTNEWETGNVPFEIRSKRCTKSGACKDACPTGAIVLVEKQSNNLMNVHK